MDLATHDEIKLESLADGAAQELFSDQLQRVLQDLVDPNADGQAKRSLRLDFVFKPGKERGSPVGVEIKASSKLAPRNSGGTALYVSKVGSQAVCAEWDPRQLQLEFEQKHKPRPVVIVKLHETTPPKDPPVPTPEHFGLHTLESFVEFVKATHDDSFREGRGLFVHVVGPTKVAAWTGVFGEHHQRTPLAVATAVVPKHEYGRFENPEDFIIALQTLFTAAGDLARVMALVGNIQSEQVQTVSDDGISQQVRARVGVVRVDDLPVPNPVTLAPYRTFVELKQPESPFVLRMRGGSERSPPSAALFEADGGRWKLTAIQTAKEWLRANLPEHVPVYG